MLVVGFDLIAFVVSLVMVGSVLVRYKKVDSLFLMFGTTVILNCLGRFLVSVSETLEVALLSNKIMYVGACYIPPLLVMLLFKLCNMRFPRIASVIMFIYSSIVMACVMTIGYNGIYYKETSLVIANGYSRLEKIYGPLHVLYPVMMCVYVAFLIIFLIYAVRMHKRMPFLSAVIFGVTGVVIMIAYFFGRGVISDISLTSVAYVVAMIFVIRFYDRMNMYDMSANILSSVEQRREYGYLVLDDKLCYISCDEYLKEIFPEINQWAIEKTIACSDSVLYTEIIQCIAEFTSQNADKKIISISDKFFEVGVQSIMHGKKQVGYLIEFVDRTLERKYYNSIENYNTQLEAEVAEKTADILHIKDMMVLGMADMVESRDSNTGGHIKRTSAVVGAFSKKLMEDCEKLGLSEKFLRQVEKAAPMHDLGKIAIDDNILRKPGKYTEEEYNEMKRHTTEGAEIVEGILRGVEDDDFVEIARNVALYHHEKFNGKGYPTQKAGSDIPIEARIMALADVFDALVSKRCYKEAYSYDKAFEIIENDLGEHFDPELGRIFIKCRSQLEEIYNTY